MFSEISELKSIRDQKRRLSEREAELSTPLLKDLSLITKVYEWFNEISENRDCSPRKESVAQRKKLIFIVLAIYSPSTLAGGKMNDGIRIKIAELFNGCSPSNISHNLSDVTFQYQNYKDFRRDIDYLYSEILSRLKVEGLLS